MTSPGPEDQAERLGAGPVMATGCIWAVAAIGLGRSGMHAALVLLPVALFGLALGLVALRPAMRKVGVAAAWWIAPAWMVTDGTVDPVLDYGAFDPHGPPMALARTALWELVVLGVTFGVLVRAPMRGPPRWAAGLALILAVAAATAGALPASVVELDERVLAIEHGTRAPLGDDDELVTYPDAGGENVVFDVQRGAPRTESFRLCSARAGSTLRVRTSAEWIQIVTERRSCFYDRRTARRISLRAHQVGAPLPAPAARWLAAGLAAITLSALLLARRVRARRVALASGRAGVNDPERGLLLDDGRALATVTEAPAGARVVVLAESAPEASYRRDAHALASEWLLGDKPTLEAALAERHASLIWLALGAAGAAVAVASVMLRFW